MGYVATSLRCQLSHPERFGEMQLYIFLLRAVPVVGTLSVVCEIMNEQMRARSGENK